MPPKYTMKKTGIPGATFGKIKGKKHLQSSSSEDEAEQPPPKPKQPPPKKQKQNTPAVVQKPNTPAKVQKPNTPAKVQTPSPAAKNNNNSTTTTKLTNPFGTPSPNPNKVLKSLFGLSPAAQKKKQQEIEKAKAEKKAAENLSAETQASIDVSIARMQNAIAVGQNQEEGVHFELRDIRRLLADNARLRAQVNDLQLNKPRVMTDANIEHMKEQLRMLRRSYEQQVATDALMHGMAELPRPLPSVMGRQYHFKLSNTDAQGLFRALKIKIHELVKEHIAVESARALRFPENDDKLPGLEHVCKDRKVYASDNKRPNNILAVIEGFVWWRLQRYIFNAPLGDWGSRPHRKHSDGGPLPGPGVPTFWSVGFGPAFFQYINEVKGHVETAWPDMLQQLHELRARTATFLDRLHGDPNWDKQVQAIDDIFGKKLITFVPKEKYTPYLRDALAIVDIALQLDIKMRRSVADWRIVPGLRDRERFLERTILFDRAAMVHADGTSADDPAEVVEKKYTAVKQVASQNVTLLISPYLARYGTENGGDYSRREVIEKARVVTDPRRYNYNDCK